MSRTDHLPLQIGYLLLAVVAIVGAVLNWETLQFWAYACAAVGWLKVIQLSLLLDKERLEREAEKQWYENPPPIHPNCRCTVLGEEKP